MHNHSNIPYVQVDNSALFTRTLAQQTLFRTGRDKVPLAQHDRPDGLVGKGVQLKQPILHARPGWMSLEFVLCAWQGQNPNRGPSNQAIDLWKRQIQS